MAQRGGSRPGAGRKKKAVKLVESQVAEAIFGELGGEVQAWRALLGRSQGGTFQGAPKNLKPGEVYHPPDLHLEFEILKYWTDRKYGKPTQRVAGEVPGTPISVVVDL